jgi:hypothetical protein
MAGKDLIDSVVQSSKIARVLGARPPEGFNYELFLDENGEKISKTKGNGVTIDEWLTYAPPESLSFYIYREPKKAKQLSFAVIPKAVDEYQQFLTAYPGQPWKERLGNPVHHIHAGAVPPARVPLTFGLLLNLVGVALTEDKALLWSFVKRYAPRPRRNASGAGRADRLRRRLFPRLRQGDAPAARAGRDRSGGAAGARRQARRIEPGRVGGGHPEPRLRGRQGAPVPEPARLVQDALRDPARHQPGPAHGQLHRALRHREQPQADRGGAGLTLSVPSSRQRPGSKNTDVRGLGPRLSPG